MKSETIRKYDGKAHLLDDADLVGQALAVLLGRDRRRVGRGQLRQAPLEPLAREVAEVVGRRTAVGRGEGRQVETVGVERHRAALGDRHGVRDRLGAPGAKPRLHLVGVLDVELVVVEAHPALVLERLAHADAQQDLVREGVVAAQVVAVVGRDGGGARLGREPQQVRDDRGLLGQAVVHDLDVEVALAEDLLVLEEGLLRRGEVAPRQRPGDLALEAAREADQALGVLAQERLVHARPVVEARQVRLGDEPHEVAVALLRRGEDRQVVRVAFARLARRLRFPVLAAAGAMYASTPMIGRMPFCSASWKKWNAPNMLPWSVTATAGMPSSATRLQSSGSRFAPSRREYWLWRWR